MRNFNKILFVKKFILLLLLVISAELKAQFQFNFNDSILVLKNGNYLDLAWSGGQNNAQFSEIDYDFDGDNDLFVFDRSHDQVRLYRHEVANVQHYYVSDPAGFLRFPAGLRYRVYCADYNQDGKNDLFCYTIGGLRVYKNVGNASIGLQWEQYSNYITSNYNGPELNLYISSADIPAIVDVEGDGDLDILTYHIGGEYLQYHQNQSQELYGHSDSLIFELKNSCWGGYREDVTSNGVFLFDTSGPCNGSNVPNPELPVGSEPKAHAGSTVLALDYDNSGVLDLILGDVSYTNMMLLINGGTVPNSNSDMVSMNTNFPSNTTPVNMQLFPAGFYLDVNFDNKKDLIVTPNANNVSENETSVLFYKNTGANNQPNFVYQTKSFLQNEMIEHGTAASPQIVDLNNDGLLDLVVSNFYAYKATNLKESRLAYYQNTGSPSNPAFTQVDVNFLNLAQSNLGLRLFPTFGDVNGDGKVDMFLGLENGSLAYFQNTSSGANPSFAAPILNYADQSGTPMNAGQYASPQLFDLNNDGKLDLVIGKKTGELMYYENTGSTSNPAFSLLNNTLGMVDTDSLTPDGYSVPHFFRYLDTTYLMVGSHDGAIHFYDSITDSLNAGQSFHERSADFLGLKAAIGAYSSCFVTDIDLDGHLDLFIGQDLGGLYRMEDEPGSTLSIMDEIQHSIRVYPNPATTELTVLSDQHSEKLDVYAFDGRWICTWDVSLGTTIFSLADFDAGLYILKGRASGMHQKFWKR
ncbi:MAG: hypothetical protein RIS20_2039 [Bacteroidota bacterium]